MNTGLRFAMVAARDMSTKAKARKRRVMAIRFFFGIRAAFPAAYRLAAYIIHRRRSGVVTILKMVESATVEATRSLFTL